MWLWDHLFFLFFLSFIYIDELSIILYFFLHWNYFSLQLKNRNIVFTSIEIFKFDMIASVLVSITVSRDW